MANQHSEIYSKKRKRSPNSETDYIPLDLPKWKNDEELRIKRGRTVKLEDLKEVTEENTMLRQPERKYINLRKSEMRQISKLHNTLKPGQNLSVVLQQKIRNLEKIERGWARKAKFQQYYKFMQMLEDGQMQDTIGTQNIAKKELNYIIQENTKMTQEPLDSFVEMKDNTKLRNSEMRQISKLRDNLKPGQKLSAVLQQTIKNLETADLGKKGTKKLQRFYKFKQMVEDGQIQETIGVQKIKKKEDNKMTQKPFGSLLEKEENTNLSKHEMRKISKIRNRLKPGQKLSAVIQQRIRNLEKIEIGKKRKTQLQRFYKFKEMVEDGQIQETVIQNIKKEKVKEQHQMKQEPLDSFAKVEKVPKTEKRTTKRE